MSLLLQSDEGQQRLDARRGVVGAVERGEEGDDLGADATVRARAAGAALAPDRLNRLDGVVAAEVQAENGHEAIALRTVDAQATLIDLLELARQQGIALSGLSTAQATLEDVFLARTGHPYEPGAEPPAEAPGRRRRRG
jgi:hypothetical protein